MLTVIEDCFENTLVESLGDLVRYARRLAQNADEANDVVQETCRRALEHKTTYTLGTNFRSWLFKIGFNSFIEMKRQQSRRMLSEIDDLDDHLVFEYVGNLNQEDNLMFLDVIKLMDSLPSSLRNPCFLVMVKGYSYEETGLILDLSVASVKSSIHRGRTMLKDMVVQKKILPAPPTGMKP